MNRFVCEPSLSHYVDNRLKARECQEVLVRRLLLESEQVIRVWTGTVAKGMETNRWF